MESFKTKNWIIGIVASSWVATFVVGYLHGAEMLSESANPLIHTFLDWFIVLPFVLVISYLFARFLPGQQTKELV